MVKRYFQQFEIDFDQNFATVVKLMIFRVLFAIAAFFNLDIKQIDLKTVFFTASLISLYT